MLLIGGLFLAVWAFDYTDFYYCLTTNFVTDGVDHKGNELIYEIHVIENYNDRNKFFKAFINEELYEICYPIENLVTNDLVTKDLINTENIEVFNEDIFVNPFNSQEIEEVKEIFKSFREDDEVDIGSMINNIDQKK